MRPSSRPALLLSKIPPHHINLTEGESRTAVCPDCETWHPIQRRMIKTHHLERTGRGAGGEAPRCPGSARRIEFDITIEQWGEALLAAEATAAARRSKRMIRKAQPQPLPAVSQMSAATAAAQRELADHIVDCPTCAKSQRCTPGAELQTRSRLRPAHRDMRLA
ncbi:hypothetical protein ACIBTP_36745 [Streptomyces avidinii]|uniref:hypothetical protein n=1 Tax=Streptomyces avidinii TaxID=1895 RepID=UPI0037A8E7D8